MGVDRVVKCSITKSRSRSFSASAVNSFLCAELNPPFICLTFLPSLSGACVWFWLYVMEAQPTGGTAHVKVSVRWQTEARDDCGQTTLDIFVSLFLSVCLSLSVHQHQLVLTSHLYICVSEPRRRCLNHISTVVNLQATLACEV